MKQEYNIGLKFTIKRPKSTRECTIVDIHKTYNSFGDLVQTRYVIEYCFMGQLMQDRDVVSTTIARALMEQL